MNAIFLLNSSDFKAADGQLQLNKSQNLTFVLFYSTQCQYCGPARETFNFVASQYSQANVKFGIINVTKNPAIPQISKQTSTPIEYVPFLIAFSGGAPMAVFSNQYTPQNFSNFVKKCYYNLKVDAFGAKREDEESKEEIPKYTVGVPFCEEGVCYLGFDDAYKK